MTAKRPNDVPVPTRDIEQAKADIAHAGYGILEGALDQATTKAIHDRLLDQATAERARRVDVSNSAVEPDDDVNQWVTMLPNKGAVFRALINNENCLGLVRSVLGDDAILSEFSAHITWPGNKEMALHTDQWFMPQPALPGEHHNRVSEITRADQPFGGPEPATWAINAPVVTNAMWAITDFTRENGATRLVPKSHHSGNHPAPGYGLRLRLCRGASRQSGRLGRPHVARGKPEHRNDAAHGHHDPLGARPSCASC